MSTHVRHPIWLPAVRPAGARTFASLYALESCARALISSVIPIQAYDLLHSEQKVSILYTVVSLLGLSATLFMPTFIRRFARRWVYTAGACLLAIGSLSMAVNILPGQLFGMLCRVMGASALSITLNLYIMDHIRKTDLMQAESLRMALSTFAWTCGPTLGIVLYARYGIYAAHGVVAIFSMLLLALFWFYRMSDNTMIAAGKSRPLNPLANIGRFVAQPRLRLAWVVAFGRSCFWTTFFVYGPLLMVVTGQGKIAGGLLVSAGNALLFLAIFWGRAGKRFGARRIISLSFLGMAILLYLAGAVGQAAPVVTGALLLGGAVFTVAIDAVGSTVFLRAVRSYERPQMAAVYRTYLDFSELTPPLVYSVLLAVFGLGSVFAALGCLMLLCAAIAWRHLPKSL